MPELLTLQSASCHVVVSTHGAEPHSLQGPDGHEYLWQAGDAWRRHAPVLFPVVGRLVDDTIEVDGLSHPMSQHGFARDLEWEVVQSGAARAVLALRDSPETRLRYPFAFVLSVAYEVDAHGLLTTYTVENPGDVVLPFALGSHPALSWPLEPGADPALHTVEFDQPEPAPVRRVQRTLLLPERFDTPVDGAVLALRKSLFAADAIVMDAVASRGLTYRAPSGRALRLTWDGFDAITVWSPPAGAELLCLEPWRGLPSPPDFAGDFGDLPHLERLDPGEQRSYSYRLEPVGR